MIYIIVIVGIILLFLLLKGFKRIKCANLSLITGAVKSGKSTIGCYLALKQYRKAIFNWRISCFFRKLFNKELPEKPLLYSNIPLNCEFSPLTADVLQRKKRIRFKSVVFVDEAVLIASNDDYSNMSLVERLEFFNKLFGHSTHGGYLFYNTQSIGDVSVEVRRCASQVFFVHHIVKWIPFIIVAYVRELVYSEDGLVINNADEDVEDSLKKVILSKRVFNMFDRYAFSWFTDDLEVDDKVIDGKALPDLKVRSIIGFDGKERTKDKFYLVEEKNKNVQQKKTTTGQFFIKS